jgi:hypothetical protein
MNKLYKIHGVDVRISSCDVITNIEKISSVWRKSVFQYVVLLSNGKQIILKYELKERAEKERQELVDTIENMED